MKRILSIVLLACIFATLIPVVSADDYSKTYTGEVSAYVGDQWKSLRVLTASYDNNVYLSYRSLAEALNGTDASFDFRYCYTQADGAYFEITTGSSYAPVEIRDAGDPGYMELRRNRLFVNGDEKRYYTYWYGNPNDLYMSVLDVCFMLNINISLLSPGSYHIRTDIPFSADLASLDSAGFFDRCSCVLSGNSKSGQVFFSRNADKRLAVASTSKLMTYVIVMEAVKDGRISYDSPVPISANVETMSDSENGLIEMKEGDVSSVRELLGALLIASSNEAALALAEYTWGSEDAFVTQMNRKARSLGLSKSRFYNCSGLPFYTESIYGIKKQSYMSGNDMFTLASYILNTYPEITDITSKEFETFPTFDYTTANSNTLVFNMDTCVGLKTGNTNQAGCCVVACDTNGTVVIVLGAEDNALRGQVAEILFRCAG